MEIRKAAKIILGLLGLAGTITAGGLYASMWWIDFSEAPAPADMIVVLSGSDYGRALYAAELYAERLAPEVWLCRENVSGPTLLARSLGVNAPTEGEILYDILLGKGVPKRNIRRYGTGVMSTVDEARQFRREAKPEGRRILVVTSRYHARRSRLIFGDILKGSLVSVVATPHERFERRWWRDQAMAKAAILEYIKLLYYLLGGRFARAPAGP